MRRLFYEPMKKTELFVWILLIVIAMCVLGLRISRQSNAIDELEKLSSGIQPRITPASYLYYVSNNALPELYYKTQFSLIPARVVKKKNWMEIPADSSILLVIDRKMALPDTLSDFLFAQRRVLCADSVPNYSMTLMVSR